MLAILAAVIAPAPAKGVDLTTALAYPVEFVTEPFGCRPVEAVHQIRHVLARRWSTRRSTTVRFGRLPQSRRFSAWRRPWHPIGGLSLTRRRANTFSARLMRPMPGTAASYHGGVMRFGNFKFGSIQIDGVTYEYDVVIDGGSIRKRMEEEAVQTLPQLLRPHAAFRRGGHSLAMPAAGGRYGSPRRSADHGGGRARGSGASG